MACIRDIKDEWFPYSLEEKMYSEYMSSGKYILTIKKYNDVIHTEENNEPKATPSEFFRSFIAEHKANEREQKINEILNGNSNV